MRRSDCTDDGIQVLIGLEGLPMFILYDEGIHFSGELSDDDLTVAAAVLRDLADGLEHCLRMRKN